MRTVVAIAVVLTACGQTATEWQCELAGDPEYATSLGCWEDFELLASEPLSTHIPGARSVKTVIDRNDENAIYFQNGELYKIHWEFASAHLSGNGLPIVPELSSFNASEYFSPDRRFVLGAVSYYQGPDAWVYELAPYDTADAAMVELAFDTIVENSFFGDELRFHPTSAAIEATAAQLPARIPVITTGELFAGIDYQPYNLASSMGLLRFYDTQELESTLPDFREIVVLEGVPNDISVVAGIITEAFQTPLAHINVLSQNRGTPNMGLRGAFDDGELRALEGKWVELSVDAQGWQIQEVTQGEADDWWAEHRPEPVDVQPMDLSVQALVDDSEILGLQEQSLAGALADAIPVFGGKASHYAGLAAIPEFPIPPAYALPVYFFDQHMTANELWPMVDELLVDSATRSDPALRAPALRAIREAIVAAPMDPALLEVVEAKINTGFAGTTRMRFRSSTNAEDINGFNGAGLYTSKTGDPNNPAKPVDLAIKTVWASVYSDRAFAEREYYQIDHRKIGMAILSHRSFPDEDANGVAITANIFDSTGLDPAFYVNVQKGEASVVKPAQGVTTDQLLYYYYQSGHPIVHIAQSNLIPAGESVLTPAETQTLGMALDAIHQFFAPVYGSIDPGVFYGMDVEFKFDSSAGNGSELYVKQARPYPGRN